MRDTNLIKNLQEVIDVACGQDLDDLVDAAGKKYRPTINDIEICLFPQTWGSTAKGYNDAIGCSAMTTDYTIVVTCAKVHCVYFGCSRLAYKIRQPNKQSNEYSEFRLALKEQSLASAFEAVDAYNAEVPE